MRKLISIFLALAILALFSFGCAGVSRSSPGFSSDESPGFPGFTVNEPMDLNYYQIYGY
jgi:hypothetical protein